MRFDWLVRQRMWPNETQYCRSSCWSLPADQNPAIVYLLSGSVVVNLFHDSSWSLWSVPDSCWTSPRRAGHHPWIIIWQSWEQYDGIWLVLKWFLITRGLVHDMFTVHGQLCTGSWYTGSCTLVLDKLLHWFSSEINQFLKEKKS